MTNYEKFRQDKTIGVRIQQGFTFVDLFFNAKDAEIYVDLLKRNRIWHVNLFNGEVWSYKSEISFNK